MIGQIDMSGFTKVERAIKRAQDFEPVNGYYLAFSGGKDSCVCKAILDMAGVKYDAHYMVTGIDPPELVYFIKEHHPDVKFEIPKYKDGSRVTMWNLIPRKKMPPTRCVRYCCGYLKEVGGAGRFVVTGVRWAESAKRKQNRAGVEVNGKENPLSLDDPDNPRTAMEYNLCPSFGYKRTLNPIIDWNDEEVWEFLRENNVKYCKLYDEGFERIGCIGCPMSKNQALELERYPKFKKLYMKAFREMLENRGEQLEESWKTAEEVMAWWLGNKK